MDELRSHEAVFGTDSTGAIRHWSREAERLTGIRAAEADGRRCWELIAGRDATGRLVCRPDCSTGCVRSALRTTFGCRCFDVSTIVAGRNGDALVLHTLRAAGEPFHPHGPQPRLTPRQREILLLLVDGLRVAQIAVRLTLSEATVRNHVRAILLELGAHSQLEAVARARSLALLPDAS